MRRVITIIFALLFASFLFAQQNKTNIVVLDPISTFKITDGIDVVVREVTSSVVVKSGLYTVVDRKTISKILEEQDFARSGLMDETKAVQVGKLAGAKNVLFSVLANVGSEAAMLSTKLIDVESGVVEKQEFVMLNKSTNVTDAIEQVTTSLLFDDESLKSEKRIAEEKRKAEEAKKKAQEEAAKKAQTAGNVFGSGDTSAGNAGKVFGSGGIGTGNSYNMNGRSIVGRIAEPAYTRNVEGVIVVFIEVNAAGTVISAYAGAAGTTIGDITMRRDAEVAAKKTKFNRISGNAIQTGTITYRYKLN